MTAAPRDRAGDLSRFRVPNASPPPRFTAKHSDHSVLRHVGRACWWMPAGLEFCDRWVRRGPVNFAAVM